MGEHGYCIRAGRDPLEWVAQRVQGSFGPLCEAIGLYRGKQVAGVVYEDYNGASVVCHIAVEGRLNKEYLRAIFDYPFNRMGVRKIIAPIVETNTKSIGFVENMGFRKEAQLLDAHPDGSLLLYTMGREQCRFIGVKYGKEREGTTAD